MKITCVTVDSHTPQRLARFWNEALDWGGVTATDDGSGAVCGPAVGGTYLEFIRVPEPKRVKNRVHLGCSVDRLADLDAEMARLIGLGASIAWEEEFPSVVAERYRNVVMRDPEGNEFCLGAGAPTD
jgi:hypothetical protein